MPFILCESGSDFKGSMGAGVSPLRRAEVSPNVTAEINDNGDLIGVEILEASSALYRSRT
ncbi:MAG: DUF2283 domain-containing protein [Thermodesulfobacteriota bacterium]